MKVVACCVVAALAAVSFAQPAHAAPQRTCHFGNDIKQLVYIRFDNVHLRRDGPRADTQFC